ncbi:MAG: UrcA family protein [Ignavibacteriales bacterium]
MRKLLSLSISAAILAWSGAAVAGPAEDPARSEVVSLGDLNLSSASGAQIALARLNGAADRVCANGAGPRQLAAWTDYRACRRHALDASVSRLDSPLVTARYFKKLPVENALLASR